MGRRGQGVPGRSLGIRALRRPSWESARHDIARGKPRGLRAPRTRLPYLRQAIEEGKQIEDAAIQRLASRFLAIAQVKLARMKGIGDSDS